MIVNIRGTSGAGKSYVVRAIMRRCESVTPEYALAPADLFGDGQSARPIGYACLTPRGDHIWVAGHYEVPSGGCDRLLGSMRKSVADVYAMIRERAAAGASVVYEGLIINNDIRRCVALHTDGLDLHVVALQPPIEDCLASIRARRAARGDTRELNATATIAMAKATVRHIERLREAGVDVVAGDRAAGLQRALEVLGC